MFLSKLLPPEGLYCVAMLLPAGGFRHFFYDRLEDAKNQITALDSAGNTVYIAQASYDTATIAEAKAHNKTIPYGLPKAEYKKLAKKLRSQDNAALVKNFFLDIDCGEKWPLKNQKEAAAELKKFLTATGLPMPTVVNSGNGLYAHWILTEAVSADKWRTVAFLLKQVVAEYSPAIGGDSSRTSDSASVLRPPGVYNRKPGKPEKLVHIIGGRIQPEIDFLKFIEVLKAAARKKKINHTAVLTPKSSQDLNAEFYVTQDSIKSDAARVAAKCTQLRLMKDTGGDVVEPLWYACLGVLLFCENGRQVAHEWSAGYSGYSATETDEKIDQWELSGMGPTTCYKFGSENAPGCIGCPYNGKIRSPIVLGRPAPEEKELAVAECPPPDRFRRAPDGLYVENDGTWHKFYNHDLYPTCLAYDESLGYEVTIIKHKLPHEGDMECVVRSSLVNDPKALLTALADNHIKVVGVKEKKSMVGYIEGYQERLQRERRMTMLLCQMGWKTARNGSPMFVLGKKVFHADGSVEDASFARNVPEAARAYRSKGSLDKWVAATRLLGKPNMEPFAFALLAGGFGAPLMKFTGFDGALISMVGDSGVGKTLMLRMIQSIWGYHADLMMLRDDTKNALISRLGVYGNLPLTVDEVTNIDGMELSDFVYRVTQGRDKARLTKNAEERKVLNNWNTIAVTTSNSSLIDKLSGAKHDASAEINRVFEYHVSERDTFKGNITEQLYWTIHENYGMVGEKYIHWLVQNIDRVKKLLEKIKVSIDANADIKGEERFWSAVVSAACLGGVIAKELGLIEFDVASVKKWAEDVIRDMRGDKNELAGDAVGVLGQILDEHAANRLLVKGNPQTAAGCTIIEAPRGKLAIRYEVDNQRLFISRTTVKESIARKFGSYTQIKTELQELGILTNPARRKVLGAGTFFGGAQQPCWEIDMRSPRLSPGVRELTAIAKKLEENPIPGETECKLPDPKNPYNYKNNL